MDLQSPAFASHVETLMHAQHVPGLAIAVVQNQAVASAGFGWASLDPPKPCTPDTLFNIASASKSLTAASVGLLAHDNATYPHVHLNTTMSSLLPDDFVMADPEYTRHVTVEDVLSHRTGIASHDLSYLSSRADEPDDARSITRNLRNLAIAVPVRSKQIYCNMMYTAASYLVEKMAGLPFADFLEQRFFRPLQMHSTNLQSGRARHKGLGDRIATGYFWNQHTGQYQGSEPQDALEAQGAGSVITSFNDYIKWARALANNQDPITRDVYDELVKPRILDDAPGLPKRPFSSPMFYGAVLETYYYRGHAVVGHDGSDPGFRTSHFFLPDLKAGGVIFANSEKGGPIVNILMREVIDEFLRVPEASKVDWVAVETKSPDGRHRHRRDPVDSFLSRMCPGTRGLQPQSLPLAGYAGSYWNPGYHDLEVQVRNGSFFIDAGDRSFPFTIRFEHLCHQNKYLARMVMAESKGIESPDTVEAEFRLRGNEAVKMGVCLDNDLHDLIWFDRVDKDEFVRLDLG